MTRDAKLYTKIESSLKDEFDRLAAKKNISASALVRAMIIDELRLQGLLPEEFIISMFKGVDSVES